jgi:hypothetical protein
VVMDERLALLLHPVRLRLVHAMRAGGRLTTGELCARLPDLPKATVYRQVDRLVRGGVFRVESERKVRGVIERRYQLGAGATAAGADGAQGMTIEDHRRGFTAAMAALIAEFGAYLDRDDARPAADEVSYRQFVIRLTREERSRFIDELGRMVRSLARNQPDDARAPYMLSTVFFPTAPGPADRS